VHSCYTVVLFFRHYILIVSEQDVRKIEKQCFVSTLESIKQL